jgi:hypothetical protein
MAESFTYKGKGRYFAHPISFAGLTSDSIVLFGFGLNEGVSNEPWTFKQNMTTTERVQQGFMNFVDTVRKLPSAERPHLLWMNLPATGMRKPPEFLSTQDREKVLKFNAGTLFINPNVPVAAHRTLLETFVWANNSNVPLICYELCFPQKWRHLPTGKVSRCLIGLTSQRTSGVSTGRTTGSNPMC